MPETALSTMAINQRADHRPMLCPEAGAGGTGVSSEAATAWMEAQHLQDRGGAKDLIQSSQHPLISLVPKLLVAASFSLHCS